ncbi:MAG: GNAT family N-acetyltransferase [Collinsella tanakaei]|nr:MAG: GNAT family N-acetyltransferase [Collinsella tanakaei]
MDGEIRQAKAADLAAVEGLYDEVIERLEKGENTTGWFRGWYPTRETALRAIEAGEMYVMYREGALAGSMVLNSIQPDVYHTLEWNVQAQGEEILLVHTLAVSPRFRGKGISTALMDFVEKEAALRGCRCIRFDTSARNIPAIRLYERLGYEFRGTVDLGLTDMPAAGYDEFRCYEKAVKPLESGAAETVSLGTSKAAAPKKDHPNAASERSWEERV